MKVAAAIAEILKREGVEFLIGYPVNPIIEAAAEADIRTIIVRQERTGLHMADAVSRITSGERIGVFAMQHGPGTENAFGGVAQAYGDSVPIVVLPGGLPAAHRQRPAQLQRLPELPARHQVGRAGHARRRDARRDAPRLHPGARTAARGRCWSSFPSTCCDEDVPEPLDYEPAPARASAPDPRAICRGRARRWSAAERPVIYAGQGVHYAQGLEAAARRWPSCSRRRSPPACRARARSPRTIRCRSARAAARSPSSSTISCTNADLIFGIGCSFTHDQLRRRHAQGQAHRPRHARSATDINKDVPVELRRWSATPASRSTRCIAEVSDRLHGQAARPARGRHAARSRPSRRSGWRSGCRA